MFTNENKQLEISNSVTTDNETNSLIKNIINKNKKNNKENINNKNINQHSDHYNKNIQNNLYINNNEYIKDKKETLKYFRKAPKINEMYLNKFCIINNKDLSYINNKNSNIPNCFFNHLIINNSNNSNIINFKKNIIISMVAKRFKGKSIKIIYYKPFKK